MKHLRTTLAAAALAAATGLVTPTAVALEAPSHAPAAAAHAAPDAARVARTVVTLEAPGCEGCRIQPTRLLRGSDAKAWVGKPKKVRDGIVRWRVRTALTRGMTFNVLDNPRIEGETINAVPAVVFRYRGTTPRQKVTDRIASKGRRASACFIGTKNRQVTRRVVTRYFSYAENDGRSVTVARYYTRRANKALKPYSPTFHGLYATQDLTPCRG